MPSDAIALLKADHREVEALFEKFESTSGNARKGELGRKICTMLSVHATIEEEIFYPACKGAIEEDSLLDEAYVEHDGAKVLISELSESSPDSEFYDAKVKVLSEMIKHHVKEEERRSEGLFAQARDAGLDMEALGRRMETRKRALLQKLQSSVKLPPPETRSFTGHKLIQSEPIEALPG